jgi:transposase-like protein
MRIDERELFKSVMIGFMADKDPMLAMLKWITQQLMQIEAEMKVGANKNEHNSQRKTHFSGYRPRRFDTRMGTMYLMVPKLRQGGYVPFFVTAKKRSEEALISIIQEAYVNGVSTRKIERLAKEMGIEGLSASQVSQINKGLDEQVEAFRNRPLQKEYPFIYVDALYEKIRSNKRVISTAMMIAYGVGMDGKREVLAIEPFFSESNESWRAFFKKLKHRGLEKCALVISDAHQGIQNAVKTEMTGSSWQRCKVHFMRNILAYVSPKSKALFSDRLKQIWLQKTLEDAQKQSKLFIQEYEARYPEAIQCLEEGLEDSLQFFHFDFIDHRRISSTNVLERLNREVRRRSKVVGIFPSRDSYLRLLTSYLMEYTEEWEVERSYIQPQKLELVMIKREALLQNAA